MTYLQYKTPYAYMHMGGISKKELERLKNRRYTLTCCCECGKAHSTLYKVESNYYCKDCRNKQLEVQHA